MFYHWACPLKTVFLFLFHNIANMNLATYFCPFLQSSHILGLYFTIWCLPTICARCTCISSIWLIQVLLLFHSHVVKVSSYFCNKPVNRPSTFNALNWNQTFTSKIIYFSHRMPCKITCIKSGWRKVHSANKWPGLPCQNIDDSSQEAVCALITYAFANFSWRPCRS